LFSKLYLVYEHQEERCECQVFKSFDLTRQRTPVYRLRGSRFNRRASHWIVLGIKKKIHFLSGSNYTKVLIIHRQSARCRVCALLTVSWCY